MKGITLLFSLMLTFACRDTDDELQEIDQLVTIYYRDAAGNNLLDEKQPASYRSVVLKDLGGLRDQIQLSGNYVQGSDNETHLQYTAGATRVLTDSVNAELKNYRSDIRVELRKTAIDSVDVDTLTIFYRWTPQSFRVERMLYNRQSIFKKVAGQPNVATVVK